MKFLVLKKNTLKTAIIIAIVAILLSINFLGGTSAMVYHNISPRLIPIYNVETEEKKIAITFDSAWGADKTLKILEILKQYNATGTFFLVGFWVDKYPDMVKAIDQQGVEIGTHSNTHPDFAKLSEEQMLTELSTSMEKIKTITGKDVKLFRSPYGSYNNTSIRVGEELGLKTIQWNIDTLDWKGLSGGEMLDRVLDRVVNGSIILCHNNSDNILEGLTLILDKLTSMGYEFVSVGDLILQNDYYIDNLGVQRKK